MTTPQQVPRYGDKLHAAMVELFLAGMTFEEAERLWPKLLAAAEKRGEA